jgi:flavin reductase (DIM6/NTAB) family NADH-FMN oxidoreductase RutF
MQSGVYVVTADDGEKRGGCTAVWVTRASFEPAMIAVFIAPKRYTHDVIKRAGHFCLNIIGEHHKELARTFGFKSSAEVDKFAGVIVDKAKTGAPLIKEACAYIDCELAAEFPAGDHTCFVGKVVAADRNTFEKPLAYSNEDFFPKASEAQGPG